jgi:hypothetical protein
MPITYYDCCALTRAYWDECLTRYRTRVVTQPIFEEEPITLAEARYHLRVDTFEEGSPPETVSDDDPWLQNIGIPAARQWAEGYLGEALATQTLEMVGNAFPSEYFELAIGPVQSIESVKYDDGEIAQEAYQAAYDAEFLISGDEDLADAAGDAAYAAALEQTMDPADYQLNPYVWPNRLQLAYGVSAWPTARDSLASVRIRYVSGYTQPGDSPEGFVITPRRKIGLLLMLGHLYENREDTSTFNVSMIPNHARVFLDLDRKRPQFA